MTIKENTDIVTPPEGIIIPAPQKTALPGQPNSSLPAEYGGRKEGLEATRYGDWELNGKCVDF